MTFRKFGLRATVTGLLLAAGLALAPAAFARDHFSVGISLPGVSVGYGNGWHGRGFVGVGVGGYYAPAPVYYDGYYAPYPAYGYGVAYGGPVVRVGYPGHYYRGGYYARDRNYYRAGYHH